MTLDNTVFGSISLCELGQLVLRTKKYIFQSNIRKFLPVKTKVNKSVRNTLLDEPDKIFYYNNGITIVVKDFKLIGNELKLISPQKVNGAQTSKLEIMGKKLFIKGLINYISMSNHIQIRRLNFGKC
jgi:AIPR protein